MQYDVFLSHNSADKPDVEALAQRLTDEGIRPWLDKWNLIPGDPWQEAIEEALDACQTVAVFLGPNGIGPWENEEMRSAIDERVRDKSRRVIPVLLPGATKPQSESLPRFLRRLTWVNFPSGLDDEDNFYRLIAGIRGVAPRDVTSSAGTQPKSFKPDIPWLLAYLPNREEQEAKLSEQLQIHQQEHPKRPFVCITRCDEEECNDTYLVRLQEQSLCKYLGLDPKKAHPHRESFSWPDSGDSVDERFRFLLSNLADTLTGSRADSTGTDDHLIAKLSQVVSNHLKNKHVAIIDSHSFTKNAHRNETDLINRFIELWTHWPDLRPGQFLFVCVGIVYNTVGKLNFLKKHFSEEGKLEKRNGSIEAFIRRLDFSTYDGLHGVILPKLPPIARGQAENWVRGTVREFFSEQGMPKDELGRLELNLLGRIRSMYDDCEEDSIPMRTLAKQLETILKEVWV